MSQRVTKILNRIDAAADDLFNELLNEPPSQERDVMMSRINNASASMRMGLGGVMLADVEAAARESVQ